MPLALRIGFRYLRAKRDSTLKMITWVAIAGVTLGVGALLSVLAITGGFQKAFRDRVLGVNAHVLVLKYGVDFSEYGEVVKRAEARPDVLGAAPFVIQEMMLAKGRRLASVLVKGVDPKRATKVMDIEAQVVEGSLDELTMGTPREAPAPVIAPEVPATPYEGEVMTPESATAALQALDAIPELPDELNETTLLDSLAPAEAGRATETLPGMFVGATLAKQLEIEVGDAVRLISPLASLDAGLFDADGQPPPRQAHFRVAGIVYAGFQEYDARLVYAPLRAVQTLFEHGDVATGVEIKVQRPDEAARIARELEATLGGTPYHTMDWADLNRNLFTALELQKIMLSLVIATIILVAAFNVIATLIMVVLNKRREIAILKAMGAHRRTLINVFALQGLVVGATGTALGLLIGGGLIAYLAKHPITLDPKVYLIDHLPVLHTPSEYLLTAAITLAICLTATLIPSAWAARLPPVQGLRYES